MDQIKDKVNNAKVLLFGEHSLMCGSMALSIPFDRFHGKLVFAGISEQTEESRDSNFHIGRFLEHIIHLNQKNRLTFSLDIDRLSDDVSEGLWFNSNIPQGYGLGSSGALVASIFQNYGNQLAADDYHTTKQLLHLKSFFALLESYFHGTSSGLDPLISFLNKAVLISGKDEIETFDSEWYSRNGGGAVFLIDSGVSGDTQPLVDYFKKSYQEPDFKKKIDKELIPLVNKAIRSYTSGNTLSLLAASKKLSALQLNLLSKMIPESVHGIWQSGLDTDDYYLKLCGSGGGGMILGFANDSEKALKVLSSYNPLIIHSL